MTTQTDKGNVPAPVNAWAPERDRAVREFDRAFADEKRALLVKHGPNASIPYQEAARRGEILFEQVGEALRLRVRELLPGREAAAPDDLATYLIEPLEQSSLQKLQALIESWRARGSLNPNFIQNPVNEAKSGVRKTAASIRSGIAEDLRADQRRRAVVTVPVARAGTAPSRDHVITIHGIRTRGEWQKKLTPVLSDAEFVITHRDYGFFGILKFLWKASRNKQVEQFKDDYLREFGAATAPPHLIAHSFGTYIAAEAMRRYSEVRFRRIVLCGAIIERGYSWETLKANGQVDAVLNELGGRDWEVRMAEWSVPDAGPSGRDGFTAPGTVVTQNLNIYFRHSDAMYPERVRQKWIPFLRREQTRAILPVPPAQTNRRFRGLMWLLAMAVVIVLTTIPLTQCAPRLAAPLGPAAELSKPTPAPELSTPLTSLTDSRAPSAAASPPETTRAAKAKVSPSPSPPRVKSVEPPHRVQAPAPLAAARQDKPRSPAFAAPPALPAAAPREDLHHAVNIAATQVASAASAQLVSSEEDTIFLATMKGYGTTTSTIREALVWLVGARTKPLACATYKSFVSRFATDDTSHPYFRTDGIPETASRDDVIEETAYYVDTTAPGCMTELMALATTSTTTHVLLAEQATPGDEPMAQRKRRHARALARRMDDVLLLLKAKRLIDLDSSLHARANYLAFMAAVVINTHQDLVPKGAEALEGNPFWRSSLRTYVESWRARIFAIADAPCEKCDQGAVNFGRESP